MIEDSTILMLIASRLSNGELEVLMRAGLWDVMRKFAILEQFWYLRVEHYARKQLKWEPREWKKVYGYLSSGKMGTRVECFSHLDTVQVILELGYIVNKSLDFYMRRSCCNLTILNLLEEHAKLSVENMNYVLGLVIKRNETEVLHWLLARYPEEVKLSAAHGAHCAARSGNVGMLRAMIELGGMDDECFSQSVHDVCEGDYIEVLQILLDYVPEDKDRRNRAQNYALTLACTYGCIDIIRLLIDNYVNPGVNNGRALTVAAHQGRQEVVELLLVDPRVNPGADKSVAFRLACEAGNLEIAQLLSQDRRVDESAHGNGALRNSALNKRVDVVKWLLTLDNVDPLGKIGKLDSLDMAARGRGNSANKVSNVEIFDMLIRDRRVEMKDISGRMHKWISLLRPSVEDKLGAYLIASTLSGCQVVPMDVILKSIFDKSDTLHSLFQFILVKRPNSEELTIFVGDCEDEEVETAIRSVVIKNHISVHTSELFTACRALILVLTGWDHVTALRQMRHESGVTDSGMISAARLIAVHLGAKAFSFQLW